MLFNIMADMLAIMTEHEKADGFIEGVVPYLVDEGLSIFQYVDTTILFMEHDFEKAIKLKLILLAFEQLSGLKLISIRASCYVLVRPKTRSMLMPICLVVGRARFL
jgi:hypothetical protein